MLWYQPMRRPVLWQSQSVIRCISFSGRLRQRYESFPDRPVGVVHGLHSSQDGVPQIRNPEGYQTRDLDQFLWAKRRGRLGCGNVTIAYENANPALVSRDSTPASRSCVQVRIRCNEILKR